MGIKCIIVSAVTYPLHKSVIQLKKTVKHFGIVSLIDGCYVVNMVDGSAKAKVIARVLKKYKIRKKEALMIGDGYWQDYKFVRRMGIPALLVNSPLSEFKSMANKKS
jgi:FMN phosphatase YigB (HAD superfamily)